MASTYARQLDEWVPRRIDERHGRRRDAGHHDRVPFRVPVQLEPHDLGVVWVTDEEHAVAALRASVARPR